MIQRWARQWLGLMVLLAAPGLTGAGEAPPRSSDWPGWRGPRRDALSPDTGLLKKWPPGGPRLTWRVENLGAGFSTPSIAAGRIFTMGNREQTEYVIALKEDGGQEVWAAAVGKVRSSGGGYPGPRCTPTVDGALVYALGLNGDLLCLESATGKEVWRKDLVKDLGGQPGAWGYSESPLVDGDWVLCTPGGRKAPLVALDRKSGEVRWATEPPRDLAQRGYFEAQYASIIATTPVKGLKQYVQFFKGGIAGVDARDGRFLWNYDRPANGTANCTTPVVQGNLVFAASAYGTGGGLVQLAPQGQNVRAVEVYFTRNMKNHHGGVILLNGYLYGSDEGRLVCLDFRTGKLMWESRRPGKGSIGYADGCLYYRNEGGPIFLVLASPRGYLELGRFEQPDRSSAPAWPHPIVVHGKLYIRDQELLLCYDVRGQ